MKVLICGGRGFADVDLLERTLDALHTNHCFTMVIHGAARGADTFAGQWADKRGIEQNPFRADWKTNGTAAGPIRNRQMLDEARPDLIVAFPGGKGTADMVRQGRAAGVKLIKVMVGPP